MLLWEGPWAEERVNPDNGATQLFYEVTDHETRIRSLGYETRLFIKTQLDDLPWLTKAAIKEMDELIERSLTYGDLISC